MSQARRRLSIVSDNHLIEGYAHPNDSRGACGDGYPVTPSRVRAGAPGMRPPPPGVGFHEGQRRDRGDVEDEEEIPCIVSRCVDE